MAGISTWTGAVTQLWDNAGNWTNGVPTLTTDEAIIPPDKPNITGDDQAGKDVGKIHILKGSAVHIGALGAPLIIAAEKVIHEGTGGLYLRADSNATGLDIEDVRIMCGIAGTPVVIDSSGVNPGNVGSIYCQRGALTIGASMISAGLRLEVGFMQNLATDSIVVVSPGPLQIAEFRQSGGVVDCDIGITDGFCSGGTLNQDTVKLTALETGGNHTLNYLHKAIAADGTILRIGGNATLDVRSAEIPDETWTLTELWLRDQAVFSFQEDLHVVTNLNDLTLSK